MGNSKYAPLTSWLRQVEEDHASISFDDLEGLLGFALPPSSATKGWWGNAAKGQAASWVMVGWVVSRVDVAERSVWFKRGAPKSKGPALPPIMDGLAPLERLLEAAGKDLVPFFARHCVFLHPDTVNQTQGLAVFPSVRADKEEPLGSIGRAANGDRVMFDDNASPTYAFLWAAGRKKAPNVQFNHVWQSSRDPAAYTALWNLCCTPAFLARLTDGHAAVKSAIAFHAWSTFGAKPASMPVPRKPEGYDDLEWAQPPDPLQDLRSVVRERLAANQGQRIAKVVAELGWLFA